MKKVLLKMVSLITAVSIPAVYSVKIDTDVSAVSTGSIAFSLPDFEYIVGQNDGKPVPVSNGTKYHKNKMRRTAIKMPSIFDMR